MKGYCGIDCNQCDCFKATQLDDDRMRMDLAIKWSKLFNRTILPREINCKGCTHPKVRFSNCESCKIRKEHINGKDYYSKGKLVKIAT